MPLDLNVGLTRPFKWLAWSNLAAQSAEQIALAAIPLVAIAVLGANPEQVGLLQTVVTLPFVLLAIPAGLLADRIGRARLMTIAESLRVLVLLAVVGLIASGGLGLVSLGLLGFLAVCGTVVFSVTAPALVPSLVGRDGLSTANARLELARTVAFAGGPALGGLLVGIVGPGVAFGAGALLSVLAALCLSRIPERAPPGRLRSHPLRDMADGFAFVAQHRLLAPVFFTQSVFNAGFFMIFAVLVPHAVGTLGLTPGGVGVLLGCYGAGMIVGAFWAPAVMARLRFGAVVAIGPISGFAASVLMALTSVHPNVALAAGSLILFGIGPILWVVSTATLRQSVTPAALLGRVSAVNILSYGARPLGSALGAAIAAFAGIEGCLWAATGVFAVQMAAILLSPVASLDERPALA